MKMTTNPGSFGIFARAIVVLSVVAAAAGCSSSSPAKNPAVATLRSINVTPSNQSIAKNATLQFVATGTFSDNSTKDLSAMATWSSSSTATATITPTGLATGVAMGNTTITATSGGVSGTTTLNVTDPNMMPPPTGAKLTSITVTTATASIATGATAQFFATGHYDDGTTKDLSGTATWASGTPATATITPAGLATGVAAGMSVISATSDGITGMTTLTVTAPPMLVSIAVTPAAPSIAKGTTQPFIATGTFSDNSTKDITATVTWASATTATATITAAGVASGVAPGTSVISATSGAVMGMTTLTVTGATLMSIAVTPDAPSIAAGTKQPFVATGTFKDQAGVTTTQDISSMVTWASATTAAATITTAGLATGVAVGSSVISAASMGVTGMTTLTVTTALLTSIAVSTQTPSIPNGNTATFVATGMFTDGSTQVLTTQATWASATPGTATIVATTGVAKGVGVGTTVISAKVTTGTGATAMTVTGMLTLTVTNAVLVSIAITEVLPPGAAPGGIAKNTKVQLVATGTYSDTTTADLTTTATWASSAGNVTIATAAGSEGLASAGNNPGLTTITAKVTTGTPPVTVTGTLMLTVTPATLNSIVVTPAAPTIAAGTQIQFDATGFFSDATKQFVTENAAWQSSDALTATVSSVGGSKGLAKGVKKGMVTVTATVGTAAPATATLIVSDALLTQITITPDSPSVALGTGPTLHAEGSFSDGTKQNLTDTATWKSATGTVATISDVAGSKGKVTPVAKGTSVITAVATRPDNVKITGMVTLTVTDAVLMTIDITAATAPPIEKGNTVQLTAMGTFTAGPKVDLTKMVTWSTSDDKVATVSNLAASAGLLMATGRGTATITATSTAPSVDGKPVVDTFAVTVNDGVLKSIAVTPATPSIAHGTKLQFVAMGTYDDTAVVDITSSVNWASDAPTVATFDNVVGDEGVATAGAVAGPAKITASQGTISGSATLTVTAVNIKSIVITPNPTASIAKGTTVQFTATGFFTDGSTQDVTDTANWQSSAIGTATISNDPASNGLAFGKAQATAPANITATVVIGGTTATSMPTALTVTKETLVSVAITPATAKLPKGSTMNLIAMGTFTDGSMQDLTTTVAWAPTTGPTATVSNANNQHGRATGVAAGTVDVTATMAGAPAAHASITVTAAVMSIAVTPATPSIAKAATQQFTATATLTDNTPLDITSIATWLSDTKATATISATGLATAGNAAGTTKITAGSGGKNSPPITLTVTAN
jgi:hypothetical protein